MPFTSDSARQVARNRWENKKHGLEFWNTAPMEDCESRLAIMREEMETASRAIQQRLATQHHQEYKCHTCEKEIAPGRWCQQRTRLDNDTGLPISIYFCSARCIAEFNHKQQGTWDVPR